MSDDGNDAIEKVKVKRVQTEKQKEAFKKCLVGRQESLKVKNENNENMKAIKKLDKLEGKVNQIKKTLPKIEPESKSVSESESESDEEIVVISRNRKQKKKKKVILISSESESEEEVIQKPKVKKVDKPIVVEIPLIPKKTLSFY